MSEFELQVEDLLTKIAVQLTRRNWRMATAESCTGGWIAKCCTDRVGSSDWFDRAYVSYSYDAKEQMLGVSHDDLIKHGAVSELIARQMAIGAKQNAKVEVAVAVTGIAGPGSDGSDKPVGLVHFGWCIDAQPVSCDAVVFEGDRGEIRQQTVLHALEGIVLRIESRG